MSRFPLAILVFFMTAGLGWAQQSAGSGPALHSEWRVGYDQGDFGTGETSRAAYLPVSCSLRRQPFRPHGLVIIRTH